MPPKKTESAATKKVASGPSYQDMIKDAIINLKDRSGSSRPALKKYVKANNSQIKADDKAFDSLFNRALKAGVEKGVFTQPKGSSGGTKLAPKAAAPKKEKTAAKPAVAKKPKAAATKKAPAAKKAAAPKKAAVKKAPAAKKAAAPKKAAVKKAPAAKKADAVVEAPTTLNKTKTGRVTKTKTTAAPKAKAKAVTKKPAAKKAAAKA